MANEAKTETEKFLEREQSKPDQWTLAWWRQQWDEVRRGYAGSNHAINLCHAEYAESWTAIEELRKRHEAQVRANEELAAVIGQLRGRVSALETTIEGLETTIKGLETTIEKCREAYAALRK